VVSSLPEDTQLLWAEFLLQQEATGRFSNEPADGLQLADQPAASRPRPKPVMKKSKNPLYRLSEITAKLQATYNKVDGEVPKHVLRLFADVSKVLEEGGPMAKVVADAFRAWSIPNADSNAGHVMDV
jgi:hypothetical protein